MDTHFGELERKVRIIPMQDIDYSVVFDEDLSGVPCDLGRLQEIERNCGRKLPESYARLIEESGGGYLNDEHSFLPGDYLSSEPDGVVVEQILGNGILSNDVHNSLDDPEFGGLAIAKEWDYPKEALLFAISEAGAHIVFMINYDFEQYPLHSIPCLNDEMEGGMVAESFDEFIQNLTEWDEEDEDLD